MPTDRNDPLKYKQVAPWIDEMTEKLDPTVAPVKDVVPPVVTDTTVPSAIVPPVVTDPTAVVPALDKKLDVVPPVVPVVDTTVPAAATDTVPAATTTTPAATPAATPAGVAPVAPVK